MASFAGGGGRKAKFTLGVRPPNRSLRKEEAVEEGVSSAVPRGSVAAAQLSPAMDAVPATVPSVTASPGTSGLLGPLSVLYAAFIAKLLEVTVPVPGRDPSSGRRADEF